jgi:hypothetical protein
MPAQSITYSEILGKIPFFFFTQFPHLIMSKVGQMFFKVLPMLPFIDLLHKFYNYENMSHQIQVGISQHMLDL